MCPEAYHRPVGRFFASSDPRGRNTQSTKNYQDLENPDFAAFAENCGGRGVRVEAEEELDEGLETALGHNGPALVEVLTDSDPV
jgi:thiamine pyrophosphate-dependent acetolactate synthase large subunit-like protein